MFVKPAHSMYVRTDCHIVSSDALRCTGVHTDDFIEHFFSDLGRSLRVESASDVLHGLLIGETIPNAIAAYQNEFICWVDGCPVERSISDADKRGRFRRIFQYLLNKIWFRRDHLFRRRQEIRLLVFQITNASR